MNEWTNERMNEWTNERMNEGKNERMNERMKERTLLILVTKYNLKNMHTNEYKLTNN